MSAPALADCPWLEPGGMEAALRIAEWLETIGIPIRVAPLPDDILMPNTDVIDGEIIIDPARPGWPGDLLHEAGHLAVTAPERRASGGMSDDPAEEMASIAWSAAAARACGVPLEVLFHDAGYKGRAAEMIETFSSGRPFGTPMLALWGMTAERPGNHGLPVFPDMARWLR